MEEEEEEESEEENIALYDHLKSELVGDYEI